MRCEFGRGHLGSPTPVADDLMSYDQLVNNALRQVIRDAIARVAAEGLPGEHHFYITFKTRYPGVELPSYLVQQYPQDMTVVLKTRFKDLEVYDEHFAVVLYFKQKPENLVIPFTSVMRFVDPSVDFDLRFEVDMPPVVVPDPEPDDLPEPREGEAEVVRLDAFRKK